MTRPETMHRSVAQLSRGKKRLMMIAADLVALPLALWSAYALRFAEWCGLIESIGSLPLSLAYLKINGLDGALSPQCGITPPNGGAFDETADAAIWRTGPANWRGQVFRQNAANGHLSLL
ncbi:hypothetical protein LWH48_17000 [Halomonas sp. G15]|uniref:hypothetical protein n=1 Tax=Halomonas sp. G15 TaxID=2903521 RepID=UPI001E646078|nr:hypothetical protein [Halomonas sp. G15]MCE0734464.1 hypothetical protein [Halomonas sp. G15]